MKQTFRYNDFLPSDQLMKLLSNAEIVSMCHAEFAADNEYDSDEVYSVSHITDGGKLTVISRLKDICLTD